MCDGGVSPIGSSDADMTAGRRMCYGYSESICISMCKVTLTFTSYQLTADTDMLIEHEPIEFA